MIVSVLLQRQFDIFIVAPAIYVNVEAGTALHTLFISDFNTVHLNDSTLRLGGNLVGHIEIERLDLSVLQAHLKVQGIPAFRTRCIKVVGIIRYAE